MDNNNISRFRCVSSLPTIGCSIELLINNSTEDFLRFSNSVCHHRDGSCDPAICTCSSNCLIFEWYSTRQMVENDVVSCEMRFPILGSYVELVERVLYNGKGILSHLKFHTL